MSTALAQSVVVAYYWGSTGLRADNLTFISNPHRLRHTVLIICKPYSTIQQQIKLQAQYV